MRQLLKRSGTELLTEMDEGNLSHHELQETQFRFAKEADKNLNAFIAWDDELEEQAWDLGLVAQGPRRLERLPYAAKDIFATDGLQTTAGSLILKGYRPPYDATCISAMRRAKNHLMGKTNLDEFAMGSSGESSAYGPTRNPWSFEHVPGGSSSGSAAAVAACQSVVALGTDTGGSIRQPASFCGVVGFKPSYGLVSRYGLIAYSSSCDQTGVFARCSSDVALTMNTISTPDSLDSTCVARTGIDYFAEAEREVHWGKLRVGVLRPFMDPARIEGPVLENYQRSLQILRDAGASIVELEFPLVDHCLPAYYIITAAECSSNLARFDGIRYGKSSDSADLLEAYREVRSEGFGAEVKRRILLGTYVLSAGYSGAYYDRAKALRADIRRSLEEMFTQVDIIATPTSPTLPFKFGARSTDPVTMYLADLCTVFVNLADTAGISLPNGFGSADGAQLPTGLQFVCAPMRDAMLLRVANQFEKLTAWRYQPPAWVSQLLGGE